MDLSHVSTRELLETLRKRGTSAKLIDRFATDGQHLEADAEHLLRCLPAEVLNDPYNFGGATR